MITYQDLLNHKSSEKDLMDYVLTIVQTHKNSEEYEMAVIADEYARQKNRTITQYQKLLYTLEGQVVPDNYSANYKLCSNFFFKLVTQENQHLLGNGITWGDDSTEEKLGKDFDIRVQEAGYEALVSGRSFGFWNYDRLEVFNYREFAPLYDEENGALMAGVRFWQLSKNKPIRATLYEIDGYTEYIWNRRDGNSGGEILHAKRPYKLKTRTSPADGVEIYDGENYPTFPIVPLYANTYRQSELVGLRSEIDAYDLIRSGFANDLDDASQIYWTIQNAVGMDDVDLVKFINHMKTVKAAVVEDDGARAEAHTIDIPYASRETLLTRLRADIYEDFMALDTREIAGGAITATQIEAEYEALNLKTDMYEYRVIEFLQGILQIVGIEDDPSFTRSQIVNRTETLNVLIQGAQFLTRDYVVEKILTLLGDADRAEEILQQIAADELQMAQLQQGGNEE